MRVALILNPKARRGDLGDAVRGELLAHEITVVPASEPIDAVVVAGGDGTFIGAIAQAIERGVPAGLIPLGTFNDLARTLGIPQDLHAACATIAAGHTRTIDVGLVNEQYYVNEASIGISSRLARLQQPGDKRRFGLWAVAGTALQAFAHARPMRVRVKFDGRTEEFRTIQLTVANNRHFGGIFDVPGSDIDDGRLDLFAIEAHGLLGFFSPRSLVHYRSTAFEVITRRPHRIAADGEPAGMTPALFRVVPKALRVFAPEYRP
jgi:diacylglycerol kinase (ATP)